MLNRPDAKVFLGLDKFNPKNKNEIIQLLEGVLTLPVSLYIKPELFSQIKNLNFEERASLIVCEDPEKESLDMALIFEEKYLSLIKRGVVPILDSKLAEKNNILEFDPLNEKGFCFVFEIKSKWSIFAALVKAVENYKFPYDWENISKKSKKWSLEKTN